MGRDASVAPAWDKRQQIQGSPEPPIDFGAAVGLLNALILGACYFDYSSAMEACFNKLTDTFRKQMNAACNGEECPADG